MLLIISMDLTNHQPRASPKMDIQPTDVAMICSAEPERSGAVIVVL